jgi:glyoxylase-like metal-dependent hydrolase (beta-lactamase superfamily II)
LVGPPPKSWAVEPANVRVHEIAPGLWQLRLPLAWEEITHVNAYAVALETGVMLVDCGSAGDPSDRDALAVALESAGLSLADVRVLAATHTHSDHVGLAAWVIEESGCEFLMHPASAHFYDAMRNPEGIEAARERRARREGVPAHLLAHYRDVREETEGVLAPVEPDRHLVDGARLASALGDWEVIETPGHAPSHVCLVQRDLGIAIVGDLVSREVALYFDYGYSPDPVGELMASLDRMDRVAGVRTVLPGHGRPVADFGEVIESHRAGLRSRLDLARAAVSTGPAGAYEITGRMFGEPPSDVAAVWQMAEVVCYLAHLRRTGEIVRGEAADGTFRYRLAPGYAA